MGFEVWRISSARCFSWSPNKVSKIIDRHCIAAHASPAASQLGYMSPASREPHHTHPPASREPSLILTPTSSSSSPQETRFYHQLLSTCRTRPIPSMPPRAFQRPRTWGTRFDSLTSASPPLTPPKHPISHHPSTPSFGHSLPPGNAPSPDVRKRDDKMPHDASVFVGRSVHLASLSCRSCNSSSCDQTACRPTLITRNSPVFCRNISLHMRK